MSFKIRRKLMGAFLVMLMPLVVLIGINRYNQRMIQLAIHKVEDMHKKISSLSDLQIALNMLIMPPNDYLITGDISERVEFNHIITEIEGHLLDISTTMRCNKCHEITNEMVKKLYRVEPKSFWSEEMASVKGIMDGLQIVKEKGEKIFKIEKPLGSMEGVVLMKEMDAMARNLIREDILKHKKEDEKELISAVKDSERVWRMSWYMMIGGFALSVSMGLFFAFFYSGFFVRPIEAIHNGADKIAAGDFKTRLDIRTGDEIEQLSNAMNEMAAQLDNFYATLEQRIEERTRELKETADRLNEAQRIAHIGSWELNLLNNILTWSDEIYRIFEIDPKRVVASYEAFLDTVHPEDRASVDFAYTNSVKTKTLYAIDHRLVFSDGRIKYVHEQCETFYDKDGKPLCSVGTVQDITERKKAEDKIMEQLDFLKRFEKVAIDREFRIKELRDENDLLKKMIGEMEGKA